MIHVIYLPTNETALCRPGSCDAEVLLQFDDFLHPHSHGWHVYPRQSVQLLEGA
jgi:hypothetical protein